MRKVVVSNIMSLDARYEGPGKNVMALPFHPAFDEYNAERLRAADTILLGRTTFEQMKGYWPAVPGNPDAPAAEREVARLNNDTAKVVVSDSLSQDQLAPWTNTTIVSRADAAKYVSELKAGPGRDIVVFGSHTMWNDLLVAGLVDELHLMVGPAFVGGGTPIFEGGDGVPLQLLECRVLDGSPLVLLRYAPAEA